MKTLIGLIGLTGAVVLAGCSTNQAASSATGINETCWVEFSGGEAPGAMGAAGATAATWKNTASGLLIRHVRGDILIDAGWSRAAQQQMSELSPQKRPIAERILASLAWRISAPEALAKINEQPEQLAFILPTHGHYDHLGGAEDLPNTPILLSRAEVEFLKRQEATPDIVAASNIRAVKHRLRTLAFSSQERLGFKESFDVLGDGSIVVVPLPGHTPGSVGVFTTIGDRPVLLLGDAVFLLEAAQKGLPKVAPLRAVVDDDGPSADAQARMLAAFHDQHPEVALLPAHDRTAWEAVFGPQPRCVARP